MDFLKKHYEKALLGVVLLGLVAGAALLPLMIAGERWSLEEKSNSILNPAVKPLTNLNLSAPEALISRLDSPLMLDLSSPNKLFNPEIWYRAGDGHLFKPPATGLAALCQVTGMTPLWTTITLDSVQTNEPIRYILTVVREIAGTSKDRRKQFFAALNEKKEGFTVAEVRGRTDDPAELVLELSDTTNRVALAKDKPFRRVDGYMVDLKYEFGSERWSRTRLREGDRIGPFGGESYKIVAIHKNEVTLQAESNKQKTTIPYNPGP
jgi:hypothetical protein